jgi:hypothetical protein
MNFVRVLKGRFLFFGVVCRLLGLLLCKRVLERRRHVAEALAGAIPKKCPLQLATCGKTIGVGSLLANFLVKRMLKRVLGFGVTLGVCLGGLRLVSVLRVLRGW